MSDETHPDRGISGQPYSAPRQAWGGNADPRNLSYEPEGLHYFGPGYEQPNDVPWDGRPPQSYLPPPQEPLGEEVRTKIVGILDGYFRYTLRLDLDEDIPACADDLAALVAEARDTFAAADAEQRRLAGWVLEHCPGEPSQDGGVVDTVIRLITSARADGAAEWEGIAERAQETVKRVAETLDCFDEYEHDGGEDHMPSDCPRCIVGAFRSALDGSS